MTDQTQEPREYTLIELDNAVQAGSISDLQRQQILQQQLDRKVEKRIREGVASQVETIQRETVLTSELDQYKAAVPDLVRDGSPLRERARREYEYLVERGAPEDYTTELAAARAVLGPLDRVRNGRRLGADRFADISGHGMTPAERKLEDGWQKIPAANRAHYEKAISRGIYADKAACVAEFNWNRNRPASPQRGTA